MYCIKYQADGVIVIQHILPASTLKITEGCRLFVFDFYRLGRYKKKIPIKLLGERTIFTGPGRLFISVVLLLSLFFDNGYWL